MSGPVYTAPDVEAAVAEYLRADTALAALVGARVGTDVPPRPTFPLVMVAKPGGSVAVQGWAYRATIDVHGYGTGKAQARLVAAECQRALSVMAGIVRTAVVTGVTVLTDIRWLPDTSFEPPQPRYVFTASVIHHPNI